MSFDGSKTRCEAEGGTMCDWNDLHASHFSSSCGLSRQRYHNSFRWTNQTCSTQVKGKSQLDIKEYNASLYRLL